MGKRGRSQKKDNRSSKRITRNEFVNPEDMDDEIDAFHKHRDIIPLDLNGDVGESSGDDEEPVLGDKDIDYDDDDEDDPEDRGLAAKIARQQKYLRTKFGGSDEEMDEEEEEDVDGKKGGWGGRVGSYYGGDNQDFELQSSDDESAKEEEEEVIRMMKERAKRLTKEDFGLEDVHKDDSDRELTLEEIAIKGKGSTNALPNQETVTDMDADVEEVKKDLDALSKEEQMNVVYSSAPELVGLLSELNDAVEELETRIDPLINKVKVCGVEMEGGMRYLEVKQLLLLAYCQAITFYLLLKSEGHAVRDHPVIARLVEIKGLLDKMKQLDGDLPSKFEEYLKENSLADLVGNTVTVNDKPALPSDAAAKAPISSVVLSDKEEQAEPLDANQFAKVDSLTDDQRKEGKRNHKNEQVGVQSMQMLKVRASLEERLRQKGVLLTSLSEPGKGRKHLKSVNGQLEAYDDFDDDGIDIKNGNGGLINGHTSSLRLSKLSQLVADKRNLPKVISGDDDLPKRDDIGERRRKHELRVLASAGINSEENGEEKMGFAGADGASDLEDDADDTGDSADELYNQIKEERAAKLASKQRLYSRSKPEPSSLPETVDGKRHVSSQIEKNRGLTRPRKKETKNPRKNYRIKHGKAVKRRKGQWRDIRKPTGSYSGEGTGINKGISRSIRF